MLGSAQTDRADIADYVVIGKWAKAKSKWADHLTKRIP